MPTKLTSAVLQRATPREKPYEIRDSELKGLVLRIQPSGVRTFICEYARHRRVTIGPANLISLTDAREKAKEIMAGVVLHGDDPLAERKEAKAHTLESFVAERYRDFVEANHSSARETLRRVTAFFPEFGTRHLGEITAWSLESWRSRRLKAGVSPSTVNHDLNALRGALSRAIEWRLLENHPMKSIKNSRVDSLERVRYLSPDEGKRLRDALAKRDDRRRQDREAANTWRLERGYKTFPEYGRFSDHLTPLVLLALNSGCRRGELLNLRWRDIDFGSRVLTVAGKTAKSKKSRRIPLNTEAFDVLAGWHKHARDPEAGSYVFPGPDGGRMKDVKTSWGRLIRSARITGFRFHDTRHDFASKLVQAGVDLNTVRELLGHGSIAMTLRYSHLAPENKTAAVAKLVQR